MKIFYSEFNTPEGKHLKELKIKNYLIAYQGRDLLKILDKFDFDFSERCSLIIDNGAFSVWKSNKKNIDNKAYIEMCLKIKEKYSNLFENIYYIALDKIPGSFGVKPSKKESLESAEITLHNFKEMYNILGKDVLPVYHQHEDIHHLNYYLDCVDYLCVSPANDETNKNREKWMRDVFSILISRNIRAHGLAVTGKYLLETFPFYSADSISWKAPTLYGRLNVWKDFDIITLEKKDYLLNIDNAYYLHHIINDSELSYNKKYDQLISHNVKTFITLENYITDLWREKGITWKE